MKPFLHSQSSAKKFGGNPNDYMKIHQWFDESKAFFPTNAHRALRHHSQGIFEAERIFGYTITNSDNKQVSVRDIGEQHVIEDLGFIPTLCDYFRHIEYQNWMHGDGKPEYYSVKQKKVESPNLDPMNMIVDGSNRDLTKQFKIPDNIMNKIILDGSNLNKFEVNTGNIIPPEPKKMDNYIYITD